MGCVRKKGLMKLNAKTSLCMLRKVMEDKPQMISLLLAKSQYMVTSLNCKRKGRLHIINSKCFLQK